MAILGISCGFHDAGVTVIEDGTIRYAAHSERYSGKKNDKSLHYAMLDQAAKYGIHHLAYYEQPWLKQLRCWYAGQGVDWNQITLKSVLKTQLGKHWPSLSWCERSSYKHHLTHAAAGFQTSPFEEATVVVIDAIGEFDCMTIWKASYDKQGKAQYKKLWSRQYPHSIGLFYSAMTQKAGLKPNEEEYILMGMSTFGNPHLEHMDDIIEDNHDLYFKRNCHTGLGDWHQDMSNLDTAATAQSQLQLMLQHVWKHAKALNNSKNLVYMGGCALNCKANEDIGMFFENIWIMPNPGDAGSSLGAAALAYGYPIEWHNPYLGEEIEGDYPVNQVLETLLDKGICGVASGRAEFGPRALGNRSLLADPRNKHAKKLVNTIKQREQFRPFGPAILAEHAPMYFALPGGWSSSDYMQVTARCNQGDTMLKGIDYPSVLHNDGTSRIQTVPKNCESGLRKLLEKWFVVTDCPMLLNTSLNIKGEPMVNNRSDADRFEKKYKVPVYS